MDEAFHTGVTAASLQDLGRRRDGPGLLRLSLQLGLGIASGLLLVVANTPAEWAVGLVVQALVQLSCFATLHECVHRTAFRTDLFNRAGAWFAALCQLMAPALMREFHFTHHRHTHELARDPELAGLPFMVRWPPHLLWLATVSGLPVLVARVAFTLFSALNPPWSVWAKALPFVSERRRRSVVWSSRLLVALHAGVIGAALAFEPRLLRLYLAVVIAHALLSVYITCEHRGLPAVGEAASSTILDRTRSFDPGWLARFVMWNMPYHAEHHAYPAVPFHALPDLHAQLLPQLRHRVGGITALHLRGGRSPQSGSAAGKTTSA